jgi:hypothetical protein
MRVRNTSTTVLAVADPEPFSVLAPLGSPAQVERGLLEDVHLGRWVVKSAGHPW